MNEHLAAIRGCVSVSAIAVLVLDKAGWHTSARLTIPDNIVLLPLLPCAPELNPAENIRKRYGDDGAGCELTICADVDPAAMRRGR